MRGPRRKGDRSLRLERLCLDLFFSGRRGNRFSDSFGAGYGERVWSSTDNNAFGGCDS